MWPSFISGCGLEFLEVYEQNVSAFCVCVNLCSGTSKGSQTEGIQMDRASNTHTHTHTRSHRTCSGITHLFIPGPEGRQPVRTGAKRRGEAARAGPVTHARGVAGASHEGILLKVRRADLSITSAGRYWARVSGQAGQRGSLWARTQVCHCAAPRALTGLGVRTSAGNAETLRGCAACAKHASMYTRGAERACVSARSRLCIKRGSACQALRWTGFSEIPHSLPPKRSHKHARWRRLD